MFVDFSSNISATCSDFNNETKIAIIIELIRLNENHTREFILRLIISEFVVLFEHLYFKVSLIESLYLILRHRF